mmetsp:Transcript_174241/g.553180  ORF Transcript_174241/g.553180 Transcript_174241/m.553180 type:complete len:249 (+) Transcript_174241:260-1006(+)
MLAIRSTTSAIFVALAVPDSLGALGELEAILLEVVLHHLEDEGLEGSVRVPASLLLQLRHVAEQGLHLRGPEVLLGDLHQHLAGLRVDALFLEALAAPHDRPPAELEAERAELAHAVLPVGGHHVVIRRLLLHHHPHRLDVVARVAPIAQGVQVAQQDAVPAARHDLSDVGGHLLGDEGASAARRLVVEEDAVERIHAVGLPIILHDPEAVQLGHGIWRARVESCSLLLGNLLHEAVELGRRGLVEAC